MIDSLIVYEDPNDNKRLSLIEIKAWIIVLVRETNLLHKDVVYIISSLYPNWKTELLDNKDIDRIISLCLSYESVRDEGLPESFVYIAYMTNTPNLYKIGVTKSIENRRLTLKTGNPFLSIIASKKSKHAFRLENKLHRSLSDKVFSGEWFTLDSETVNEIIDKEKFNRHIGE